MLGYYEILKIGDTLEKQLVHNDVKISNILTLGVDKDIFHKIDEDIYYRQFPEGTEFQPSENEITIQFEHLTIKLMKNG